MGILLLRQHKSQVCVTTKYSVKYFDIKRGWSKSALHEIM